VRVKLYEARQRERRLLTLDVRVLLAGLQKFEVGRVGRVILEHVEDELLLDRLAHRVTMGRLAVAPEYGEGLVFRRSGEGKEAQISLPPSLGHAAEELFHVVKAFVGRLLSCFLQQSLA